MTRITKTFNLKMAGTSVINLEIEGSPDLVESFVNDALIGYSGAFGKAKEAFQEYIINGIKLKAHFMWRDEKGHFLSHEKVIEIMNGGKEK